MTPEFSRPVDADTISEAPKGLKIGADETERRRLAGRFRLQAVNLLAADVVLARQAGIVHAEGTIKAAVVQSCVVTGEPVAAKIDAPFHVRFVPDAYAGAPDEDVELSAEDCDTLPLESRIDLGELAAETLALALDPYPRSKGADAAAKRGVLADETGDGPFAGLKALKDRLEKGD